MISLTRFCTFSLKVLYLRPQGHLLISHLGWWVSLAPKLIVATPQGQWVVLGFHVLPATGFTTKCPAQGQGQMPLSGLTLFTSCVRIIHVSVFSKPWSPGRQGAGLMQALLFGPRPGEACLMFSVLFAEFFGTPCLSWLLSLPSQIWSLIQLSCPLSLLYLTPVEGGVPEAARPHCPSFLAGHCPTMGCPCQRSAHNAGTYHLWEHNEIWPEKACSDYCSHNNLYIKGLGKEGRKKLRKEGEQAG